MDQLKENYGIATSRGTVGDDIKVLREPGIEIDVENRIKADNEKIYYIREAIPFADSKQKPLIKQARKAMTMIESMKPVQ
jgi:biotin operon repressor